MLYGGHVNVQRNKPTSITKKLRLSAIVLFAEYFQLDHHIE